MNLHSGESKNSTHTQSGMQMEKMVHHQTRKGCDRPSSQCLQRDGLPSREVQGGWRQNGGWAKERVPAFQRVPASLVPIAILEPLWLNATGNATTEMRTPKKDTVPGKKDVWNKYHLRSFWMSFIQGVKCSSFAPEILAGWSSLDASYSQPGRSVPFVSLCWEENSL